MESPHPPRAKEPRGRRLARRRGRRCPHAPAGGRTGRPPAVPARLGPVAPGLRRRRPAADRGRAARAGAGPARFRRQRRTAAERDRPSRLRPPDRAAARRPRHRSARLRGGALVRRRGRAAAGDRPPRAGSFTDPGELGGRGARRASRHGRRLLAALGGRDAGRARSARPRPQRPRHAARLSAEPRPQAPDPGADRSARAHRLAGRRGGGPRRPGPARAVRVG